MSSEAELQILDVIRERVDMADVGRHTPIGSLGLDSLGFVELIFDLEERFGVELSFDFTVLRDRGQEMTVGDVMDQVRTSLETKAEAA
ncbi:MAG: acyl carrier protein [Alphaproteobacteria bacterium]|nr:acyl carrier protein [Alphaproteobacteria bacterium]MBV9371709.1 acyl carrier protein [Alphaproteobacteria bacterium]MBV9902485.1 acyl carrier protein [Alphaproteobacteria bacterium]